MTRKKDEKRKLFFERFLMALKIVLFVFLLLLIPTLDRHFRVETENYKIYFFYGDSLRKPFGQAHYVFQAKDVGWDLHARLLDDWLSDQAHSTEHGPINPDYAMYISEIASVKARLAQLDREPFDGYALHMWGVSFSDLTPDWRFSILPDLDHLYDYEYPKELSPYYATIGGWRSSIVVLKGEGVTATVRGADPSDAALTDNYRGYYMEPMTLDMIRHYWDERGRDYSIKKEIGSEREMMICQSNYAGHTSYEMVIDEGCSSNLLVVRITFESENHELPDDWPLQFKMKKLFF